MVVYICCMDYVARRPLHSAQQRTAAHSAHERETTLLGTSVPGAPRHISTRGAVSIPSVAHVLSIILNTGSVVGWGLWISGIK